MNRELDLTVGKRLTLGFGALLIITLIFSVAVYVWHSQSAAAQRNFTDEIAPLTARVDSLERSLLYVGISLRSYLLLPEPQRLANYRSYTEQSRRALVQVASAAALPEGAPDISEISSSVRAYLDVTDQLAEKRLAGRLQPEDEETVVDAARAVAGTGASADRHPDERHGRSLRSHGRRAEKVTRGLVALSIIGSLLCLGIGWFTTQSIRRPTRALVRVAGAMERGDWEPALHLAPSASDENQHPRSEMLRLSRAIGSAAAAIEYRERGIARAQRAASARRTDELRDAVRAASRRRTKS